MFFRRVFKQLILWNGIKNSKYLPNEKIMQINQEILKTEFDTTKFKPLRITVEGNIGAGKTSLMNHLGKFAGVEIYDEPIMKWCNLKGHNLLHLLYEDSNRWYSIFQHYVLLTRVQSQTKESKKETKIKIFERSAQSNRYCFLEQALENRLISRPDYEILRGWYSWMEENMDIEVDIYLYLRTSPEIVFERMRKRDRNEEKNVPLQYLQELHESHEKWLLGDNSSVQREKVIVLDGNKPLEEVIAQCERYTDKIFKNYPVEAML